MSTGFKLRDEIPQPPPPPEPDVFYRGLPGWIVVGALVATLFLAVVAIFARLML